jgi:hypothetical protein
MENPKYITLNIMIIVLFTLKLNQFLETVCVWCNVISLWSIGQCCL